MSKKNRKELILWEDTYVSLFLCKERCSDVQNHEESKLLKVVYINKQTVIKELKNFEKDAHENIIILSWNIIQLFDYFTIILCHNLNKFT